MIRFMKRIPGGFMIVPMAVSAVIHTFFPQIFMIGNPTQAVFTNASTMCIVGLMLFFAGAQISPSLMGKSMKRSGVLLFVKLVFNIAFSLLFIHIFGFDGVLGVTGIAFVSAIASCNPGLYIALMKSLGDEVDEAGFALTNIVGLPFIPLCILGYANGSGIDWKSIAATLLPFLIGMVLGNLDSEFKEYFKEGTNIILPFLGIALGWSIDLMVLTKALIPGVICYLLITILNLIPLVFVDIKILKQKGYCASAICCAAALALTVPGSYAEINQAAASFVTDSVAQLAVVVVLSSIVTPIITPMFKNRKTRGTA